MRRDVRVARRALLRAAVRAEGQEEEESRADEQVPGAVHEVVVRIGLEQAEQREGDQEAQRAGHQAQEPLARRRETVARVHTVAGPADGHDEEAADERHDEHEEREAIQLGAERDQHHADDVQKEVELAVAP